MEFYLRRKRFKPFLFLALSTAFLVSCGETLKEEKKVMESQFQNVYKHSEMALLMEEMYGDMQIVRDFIMEGKAIEELARNYEDIYTAEMTEDFENNALFQQFAEVYLYQQNELFHSGKTNEKELFNNVINSCINCHESKVGCFGPVSRIKKLRIP